MEHTREALTTHLAERLCGQVARRDEARVARRLYRKPVVDGVYRRDDGALLDDGFHCLQELGVGSTCWRGSEAKPSSAKGCPLGRISCSMG